MDPPIFSGSICYLALMQDRLDQPRWVDIELFIDELQGFFCPASAPRFQIAQIALR